MTTIQGVGLCVVRIHKTVRAGVREVGLFILTAVISIFIMLFHDQTSNSYSSAALPTSGQLDKLKESTTGASTATTVSI